MAKLKRGVSSVMPSAGAGMYSTRRSMGAGSEAADVPAAKKASAAKNRIMAIFVGAVQLEIGSPKITY